MTTVRASTAALDDLVDFYSLQLSPCPLPRTRVATSTLSYPSQLELTSFLAERCHPIGALNVICACFKICAKLWCCRGDVELEVYEATNCGEGSTGRTKRSRGFHQLLSWSASISLGLKNEDLVCGSSQRGMTAHLTTSNLDLAIREIVEPGTKMAQRCMFAPCTTDVSLSASWQDALSLWSL
jgi:hypothetical protein